jgi:hypothetical protein
MSLLSMPALTDYAYIGGGFIAGGILPRFVARGLDRIGVLGRVPPMVAELGIGALSSVVVGVVTQMVTKDKRRAVQTAGGALVGALGSLAVSAIEQYLPMEGFGQTAADVAVRQAVESEVKKELGVGGMGDFLTEAAVEDDLAMQGGMGDFVTSGEVAEASTVSGGVFGAEADEDVEEASDFEYEA